MHGQPLCPDQVQHATCKIFCSEPVRSGRQCSRLSQLCLPLLEVRVGVKGEASRAGTIFPASCHGTPAKMTPTTWLHFTGCFARPFGVSPAYWLCARPIGVSSAYKLTTLDSQKRLSAVSCAELACLEPFFGLA